MASINGSNIKLAGNTRVTIPTTDKKVQQTTATIKKATSTPTVTATPTYTPSSNSSSSVSSNDLSDYYKSLLESARSSELAALLSNFNYAKGQYNDQMDDVWAQAQAQINANQVNKYTSKNAIREALANRGQLGSGLGRQEALNQRIQYDNMDNSIKNSRNNSINQIKSAITKLEADYKNNVASVNSNYALKAASL